ncbi:hypothetical protein QQ44_00970 [Mycolicibacterium setense]|uniref:PASTA domain-containing protein n=2 Tax=Mycolicibacterium setense TaxID=431269 RepID=A0ABR4Z128_9MYCO|nr:hypothetical protein QQ44_00970 [Mycolicibacterium setense]
MRAALKALRERPAKASQWVTVMMLVVLMMVCVPSCGSKEASSEEIVLPNLVGLHWEDAYRQLQTAGWTGVIDKGPDIEVEPKDRGRIVVQHPGGGERVSRDASITLRWGALEANGRPGP